MKMLTLAAATFLFVVGGNHTYANPTPAYAQETLEHGGGCRKSSPPGKCCHRDSRTGTVHCH